MSATKVEGNVTRDSRKGRVGVLYLLRVVVLLSGLLGVLGIFSPLDIILRNYFHCTSDPRSCCSILLVQDHSVQLFPEHPSSRWRGA